MKTPVQKNPNETSQGDKSTPPPLPMPNWVKVKKKKNYLCGKFCDSSKKFESKYLSLEPTQ